MKKSEMLLGSGIAEKFDFKNNEGATLSGRLELPTGQIRAFAIFAHCFTCSKNVFAASRISNALSEQGIAVLRFDFTGLGNSEGDFSNTNFSSNVEDVRSAYAALENKYEAPQILIGHSLGGAAVLRIATEIESVKAVVTIGSPSDLAHLKKLFKDNLAEIESKGEMQVNLAGRDFNIKRQFIEDITENEFLGRLKENKSRKAYLIFHSPIDETVSIDHAEKICLALKHPKSFISLDGVDHLVSKPADSKYIARIVSAWVDRYIEVRPKNLAI